MKHIVVIIFCGAVSAFAADTVVLEAVGKVASRPLDEISGVIKSRKHEQVYWVHNDSGDEARIFALDPAGNNVIPTYSRFSYYGEVLEKGKKQWQGFKVLNARNVDWEDIAVDDRYLYLADIGNNSSDREDLVIYALSEIDPTASTQSAVVKRIPVYYPEQKDFPADKRHYDAESLFSADGKLYIITKHRKNAWSNEAEAGANLYRLDSDRVERPSPLTLIDHHPLITSATGADLSPDGKTLAVISYSAIWLFAKPEQGDQWLSSSSRQFELDTGQVRQLEAVTWEDADTLLLINEQRERFYFHIPPISSVPSPSGN